MLTAIAVRTAEPREKDYKLTDSGGLHVFVSTTGHRSWRWKYRFGGKERRLILGSFPEMSLAQAREGRDEARRQLKQGNDPSLVEKRRKLKRATPSALTFERFAREWHALRVPRWKQVHADDVIRSLERDVLPALGAHDVADIDEDMILAVLAKVQGRGAIETAHRLRQRIDNIFRYAKVKKAVSVNPAADLEIVMQVVPKARRRAAIVIMPELRELLQTIEHAGASPVTKCASRVLALTAQRPGMVRRMLWANLEGISWVADVPGGSEAVWRVPAAEMKQEFDLRENDAFEHVVPLAPQAVAVLRTVRALTGNSSYVFPSATSSAEPMSENAIVICTTAKATKAGTAHTVGAARSPPSRTSALRPG